METSRLPRAPAWRLSQTGQGLEALGLADFGRGLKDVSGAILGKIIEARSETQYLEGTSHWERANTEFFVSLATDTDFENYGKKYRAFAKSLRRQIIRKGLTTPARRDLLKYVTNQQLASEKKVAAAFLVKQKDYSRASAIQSVTDFERALDVDGAVSAINHSVKAGFMSAEEAVERRLKVKTNIDWFRGLMLIDSDPAGFMEMADADADGKIDFTFLESLNYEQKTRLRDIARKEHNRLLAQGKQMREVEISQEQGRLMGLARTGELSDDIIRGSKLDEFGTGSKKTFYDILDKYSLAVLAEKDKPFKESTPEVKARVLDLLRADEITEGEISDLVGKGLSTDDADRFISRMDFFFKDPWFRRVDMYLKTQLGWDGAAAKWMHPQGGIAYKLASDELFAVIETEKLKGRDIYDRGSLIAIPFIIDYWEKVLMLEEPEIERLTTLLKGEKLTEKELAEPKDSQAAQQVSDLLPALPTDLIKKVNAALSAGATFEEILKMPELQPYLVKTKRRKPVTKKSIIDPEGIW